MVSIRYIWLMFLILSLFIPVSATTDLSGYDGYITPKFGASIYGDYNYECNNVIWKQAIPSFESNGGYYSIYEEEEIIFFQIWMNTSLHGELYFVMHYQDEDGNYQYSDTLIHSGGAGEYEGFYFNENIEIPKDMYGKVYYQWTLSTGYWWGSTSKQSSKEYTFYTNKILNTAWNKKRSITISSTEKLKDGITQIDLDTSITNDMQLYYTADSDTTGNLNSFGGTLTNIVFTNEDFTKAYPYFVNELNGGYFEHNRNTTNSTLIDLWINEDTNAKTIYMFYDYLEAPYIYGYYFGNTFEEMVGDRPNNPFTVHQIFNDWRWNESQINNLGSISYTNPYIYQRGEYIQGGYIHPTDPYIYFIPKYFNNVSQIYLNLDFHSNYGSPFLSSSWNIAYYSAPDFFLRNSTGGVVSLLTTQGKFKFYLENNNLSVEKNGVLYSNISESKTKFNNFSIIGGKTYATGSQYSRLESFYELPNNAITYSVSNATVTDYAYINFVDMLEYETFINDISVGGYIEIDNDGLFLCEDLESNILGSIHIKQEQGIETFNIIFPYTITNETEFLNISEFNYTCTFVSDVGGFEQVSENLTINFSTNRIFLDTIKPTHQKNYSSEYVVHNINSELNYTGIQTDFSGEINKIQCLKTNNNGECLKYNVLNLIEYFNNSNISKIYNYNTIFQYPVNEWYRGYYHFSRDGVSLTTAPRLFYVFKEEALISFPVEDYLDWNDTDLTENTEFMEEMFWANPLAWFSSFIYQNFIVGSITDERTLEIFKYTFLIFWSYLFILLVIWMSFLYRFREHHESVKIASVLIMPFFFLFAYLGWLGINFVALMVLLICIAVVYLWKK